MAKRVVSFAIVILIIAVLCVTAVNGMNLGFYKLPSVFDEENGIRRGLDLVGGSVITFEAQIPEGTAVDSIAEDMDVAVQMLRERLNSLGYFEANAYKNGDTRITVEIPNIKNPEEAVQLLGSTGQLSFRDADGNEFMTGADVANASAEYGQFSQDTLAQNYVLIELKPEAVVKFEKATAAAAKRTDGKHNIDIVLDEEVKSSPSVDPNKYPNGINSDSIVIEGSFTAETAGWLSDIINAGQLPFTLKDVELRSVGPQLGERALSSSIIAALIGLALVMVFMIICYRLPGVVASISLMLYTALVAVILALIRINLSLPGIAGIVLSIGMAVDANVVIFERIKEELKAGKTLKSAIESGFHRAFTAIIDSNVTTLIAAVVLYIFGTGTIKGFAITLGIGIIVSMFTALTVTRFLLNCFADFKIKNLKAYGA